MGWFEEQIQERRRLDQTALEDGLSALSDAVLGAQSGAARRGGRHTEAAIGEILAFFHIKAGDLPEGITDLNEQLEHLLRPQGVMRRTVVLEEGWHKDAAGAMLAIRRDTGEAAALIPSGLWGYTFYDSGAGKRRRVDG